MPYRVVYLATKLTSTSHIESVQTTVYLRARRHTHIVPNRGLSQKSKEDGRQCRSDGTALNEPSHQDLQFVKASWQIISVFIFRMIFFVYISPKYKLTSSSLNSSIVILLFDIFLRERERERERDRERERERQRQSISA